ncbi:MAG: prepilin-type N-terminal cleavage/methylation domain-containing protein [Planctomycetota bacterium]|nr:MAG: prepilin-type N-terminal cleavage/methylation domain-containing protein [Planctomycetota bacterium]
MKSFYLDKKQLFGNSPPFSYLGFTLIEMLVTLVLLSLILSMCYTVLFAVTTAKEKVEDQVRSGRVAEGVLSILLRDLQAAYFYNQETPFQAEEELALQKILFPAQVQDASGVEKKVWIQYVLQKNPENSKYLVLFRGVAPLNENGGPGGEFRYQEIFDQILEMKYRFWKEGKWEDDWREKGPPEGIEIRLKVMEKEMANGKKKEVVYSTIHSFIHSFFPYPSQIEDKTK